MSSRPFFRIAASLLLFLAPGAKAQAWGVEGHEIIAEIAIRHLAPPIRAEADWLLQSAGLDDMVQAAPWADKYRFSHPESEPWHFVNIPLNANHFDADRDCHEDGHGHQLQEETCVVAKIVDFAAILADTGRRPAERGMALAFLIHFIGDVHQPLHVSDNHDRGGNGVAVLFEGRPSDDHGWHWNLHAVWDSAMIRKWYGRGDPAVVAARLDPGSAPVVLELASLRGQAVHWAEETHAFAVSTAYGALPPGSTPDIESDYETAARPVIDRQLGAAGLRLAGVITAALRFHEGIKSRSRLIW